MRVKVKRLKECTVILTSLYSQTYSPSHRQKEQVEGRNKAQHQRVSIVEAKLHSNISSKFEEDMQEKEDDLKQTEQNRHHLVSADCYICCCCNYPETQQQSLAGHARVCPYHSAWFYFSAHMCYVMHACMHVLHDS